MGDRCRAKGHRLLPGPLPTGRYEFIHFDLANPAYAPDQNSNRAPSPVASGSIRPAAVLVSNHLGEEDALFYFKEISRVLTPNGRAIVTFFLLDSTYQESLGRRWRRRAQVLDDLATY